MAAREAVTAAAWKKAEKLYPNRSNKLSEVAALVGLTPVVLSQEAKRRGWKMRTPTQPTGETPTAHSSPSPLGERAGVRGLSSRSRNRTAPSSGLRPPSPQGEKDTVPRLPDGSAQRSRKAQSKTLPVGPTKESRKAKANPVLLVQRVYATIDGELGKLEKQEGKTSQDRERASRALSQITNSLEKAVEMQRDIKKAMTKASGRYDKEALAHAEDLRRAIAERLERLQRQRSPGKRSGGAD